MENKNQSIWKSSLFGQFTNPALIRGVFDNEWRKSDQ